MSYDIYLNHPVTGERLHVKSPHSLRGGTYADGGSTECWLNITYNYAVHFHRVMGPLGIRTIYGMTGAESIPVLKEAMAALNNDVVDDYWQPTEGNAKAALAGLLALAQMRPDGVWDGD